MFFATIGHRTAAVAIVTAKKIRLREMKNHKFNGNCCGEQEKRNCRTQFDSSDRAHFKKQEEISYDYCSTIRRQAGVSTFRTH